MTDIFAEARRLVSAREVAELNGLHPNRSGFICCPFHREKTASLKLYENGSWHCFGCNRGGSSIDLVAALYDLSPLDAVKKLDVDFHLGLPLDRQQTPAQHRREISDTYRLFEEWRDGMIRQLNAAFRLAHLTMKALENPADMDKLSPAETMAIQWQPAFEHWTDVLTTGEMSEMMQIFRERRAIQSRIDRILNHSPLKSKTA